VKEELNVDVIGIEEGFGGAKVGKDLFPPGPKGCLLPFMPNEVPVGRMFLAVSRLSDDESTRLGVESVREHLKSGSVTVLIAHHSMLDAVAIGIALGRELEKEGKPAANRIVVPVGAKHWFDPRLRGFWEQLQKMEYVEFYPTLREKERELVEEGKLVIPDLHGEVMDFESARNSLNGKYFREVMAASREEGSIVFVAAAAERTKSGNKPIEAVSKLIAREDKRTNESMKVMLAAAVPHAILGLFNLRVRLWEEVVDIREQALEELVQEDVGLSYPDEVEAFLWLRVAELIEARLNELER